MPHDRDRSIHQLDLERRWLMAKLDHGAYADRPADMEAVRRRVEDLDLAITAVPAPDMETVLIKLERLVQTIMPDLDDRRDDDLETVLLKAVRADMRRLVRQAIDAPDDAGGPA